MIICHSPGKIINSAFILNEEFVQLTKKETSHAGEQNLEWDPPSEGILKINTDAAFNDQSKMSKLGMVGRDSRGSVQFSAHGQRNNVCSPLEAEL